MATAADFLSEEKLSDGSRVTIRAMHPDDEERLIEAFHNLERHTIRMRFFCVKNDLCEDELKWLENMDYVSDVGLVATLPSAGHEVIIGEGRYIARGQSAEIAFTVAEAWQGRGIGGRLLQHLARIARSHGILQFEAVVLNENAPMLAVLRHSGFPMTTRTGTGEVRVTLLLSDESLPPSRD